jgi:hypothetical protein
MKARARTKNKTEKSESFSATGRHIRTGDDRNNYFLCEELRCLKAKKLLADHSAEADKEKNLMTYYTKSHKVLQEFYYIGLCFVTNKGDDYVA